MCVCLWLCTSVITSDYVCLCVGAHARMCACASQNACVWVHPLLLACVYVYYNFYYYPLSMFLHNRTIVSGVWLIDSCTRVYTGKHVDRRVGQEVKFRGVRSVTGGGEMKLAWNGHVYTCMWVSVCVSVPQKTREEKSSSESTLKHVWYGNVQLIYMNLSTVV